MPVYAGNRLYFASIVPTSAYMPDKPASQSSYRFEHDFFVRGADYCGQDADLPWTISDDLPEQIEITQEEIDLFQAYFGELLDELLDRGL